jgi:GNAT superfamily N-acetyltransferase
MQSGTLAYSGTSRRVYGMAMGDGPVIPTRAVSVPPHQRAVLAPLFVSGRMRVPRDAVIVDGAGEAWADDMVTPRVAMLSIGGEASLTYLGGDSEHPLAREFVRDLRQTELITDSDQWLALVENELPPERLLRLERVDFRADEINAETLRSDIVIDANVELHPATPELIRRVFGDGPIWTFDSPEDFGVRGLGWLALSNGTGIGELAGFATSWARSQDAIEVLVWTHDDLRGRGVATTLCVALIRDCLNRGINPHWSATNPISQHLAERLGYKRRAAYDILVIDP